MYEEGNKRKVPRPLRRDHWHILPLPHACGPSGDTADSPGMAPVGRRQRLAPNGLLDAILRNSRALLSKSVPPGEAALLPPISMTWGAGAGAGGAAHPVRPCSPAATKKTKEIRTLRPATPRRRGRGYMCPALMSLLLSLSLSLLSFFLSLLCFVLILSAPFSPSPPLDV